MNTLSVRNVHQALPEGLILLDLVGDVADSRGGRVITAPFPVATTYEKPQERVLFWPLRDANPFFHLMEALWMLGGRNDVAWLVRFNKRMVQFSDDGETFHGAYGHRWRNYFMGEPDVTFDQLRENIQLLKRTPNTRRGVIAMWDPAKDLCVVEKLFRDIPCNTHIYPRIRNGALDLTVCCRSNDIIWGAYGANAVHFSILQEYLAAHLGVKIGKMVQFSNDYHAYMDIFEKVKPLINEARDVYMPRPYTPYDDKVVCLPLVTNPLTFDEELQQFLDYEPGKGLDNHSANIKSLRYENTFLEWSDLVRTAYLRYRAGDLDTALDIIAVTPRDWDFGVACREWLERRKK